MGFVYKLTFPNGKAYIGVTAGSVAKRIARHRYSAKHQPQKTFSLYLAWRKYGEPASSILLECPNHLLADEEIKLIGEHQTRRPDGYNAAPGGSINTHDEFAREKMSRARIGMKFSDEHRRNLSLAHKGKPSPKKGKPMSIEQRQKLCKAWDRRRLIPFSDETRAKIGAAGRGRVMPAEAKEKIRAARIAYWAKKREEKANARASV